MKQSMKNNNKKKIIIKGGISLVLLVITVVVIIILSATVILSLNNNDLIGNASVAVVKSDFAEVQDAYSIYLGKLKIEKIGSVKGNGSIGEETSKFKIKIKGKSELKSITLMLE